MYYSLHSSKKINVYTLTHTHTYMNECVHLHKIHTTEWCNMTRCSPVKNYTPHDSAVGMSVAGPSSL